MILGMTGSIQSLSQILIHLDVVQSVADYPYSTYGSLNSCIRLTDCL